MAGVHCAVAGAGALPIDAKLFAAIKNEDFGTPVVGGFYAGIIDTTKGNIVPADEYQTGLRYALIVSPKTLEGGRDSSPAAGLPTGDLQWDTQRQTAGETGTMTRWDGLSATNVIIAKNDARYEVHNFIQAVRANYPAPATPGGSVWYLPAMDELELLYRNFKPNTADNDTRDFPRNFPGSQPSGTNPSSDPTGAAYTTSNPQRTAVASFQEGNAQAIDLQFYWSSTDADEDGRAWLQVFTAPGFEGIQNANFKDSTGVSVRPVRRVVIPGDLI